MSDQGFKYLVKEFGSKHLEPLKQKGAYPYECMNSFDRFNFKKCLLKNISLVQKEKEKLVMMIKSQTVTWVLKITWYVEKFGLSLT